MNCKHKDQIKDIEPKTEDCEECMRLGQNWLALRVCLTCGHVGCCESSVGEHAKKHYEKTGHPIIKPKESNNWKWCYIDNSYI